MKPLPGEFGFRAFAEEVEKLMNGVKMKQPESPARQWTSGTTSISLEPGALLSAT